MGSGVSGAYLDDRNCLEKCAKPKLGIAEMALSEQCKSRPRYQMTKGPLMGPIFIRETDNFEPYPNDAIVFLHSVKGGTKCAQQP